MRATLIQIHRRGAESAEKKLRNSLKGAERISRVGFIDSVLSAHSVVPPHLSAPSASLRCISGIRP